MEPNREANLTHASRKARPELLKAGFNLNQASRATLLASHLTCNFERAELIV